MRSQIQASVEFSLNILQNIILSLPIYCTALYEEVSGSVPNLPLTCISTTTVHSTLLLNHLHSSIWRQPEQNTNSSQGWDTIPLALKQPEPDTVHSVPALFQLWASYAVWKGSRNLLVQVQVTAQGDSLREPRPAHSAGNPLDTALGIHPAQAWWLQSNGAAT